MGSEKDIPDVAYFCRDAWPTFENEKSFEDSEDSLSAENVPMIQNLLRRSIGNYEGLKLPAAFQILICDVKFSDNDGNFAVNEEHQIWSIGGIAILTIAWDPKTRFKYLRAEMFHVDKRWITFGLDKRFMLRLSALTLSSGCSELRARQTFTH